MGVVDLAGDWKSANADRLQEVTVQACDPDNGPADDDERAENVPALMAGREERREGARGGEVGVRVSSFELAACDVGFVLRQRHRITDAAGVAWIVDTVKTDAAGQLYRGECTEARS